MPKKVTMETIAKKLGISKNTVSLTLRGIPGISESTRNAILETAHEMGYQYKAANEKKIVTRNLCLVIAKSTLDSIGFFSLIQLGIEDEAKKNNINTIIHYYDESEEQFEVPNCIRDAIISGIITLGSISRKTIDAIIAFNLPVVMVDNYYDDLAMDCILTDNQCGGYLATKYLIEFGHNKIGFLGDIFASISFYDRYQGYLKALKQYQFKLNTGYSVIDKKLEDLALEDIFDTINNIKFKVGLPTAFVCCNDAEAITVIKALKTMGIAIPDEISVIGFDDIETARNITPELTTMNIQKELMGKRAVCKLLKKINGENNVAEKVLLSAGLVKRQSVRQIGFDI